MNTVPNYIPSSFNGVAIIGEAPGAEEVSARRPFVGMSGRFLGSLCARAGFSLGNCFIGNVCQHRPPGNDISLFSWNGDEIQSGLLELFGDLRNIKPKICILLGKTALRAFDETKVLSSWRGSYFTNTSWFKCLASYHPAACLRNYEWTPILQFDLRKAKRWLEQQNTVGIPRVLDVPSHAECISRLLTIHDIKPTIAIDIEGYVDAMTMISIAVSPYYSFVIQFGTKTEEEEIETWYWLSKVLADPGIGKILQNSLYDRFVIQYSYNLCVRGVVEDTMLKHWEKYCELEKSLAFLCSIYTDEPFYKDDRDSTDRRLKLEYCARDSAVTYEISNVLDPTFDPGAKEHYRFNIGMLNPLLYMELRGIRYNIEGAATRQREVMSKVHDLQYRLDVDTDHGISHLDPDEIFTKAKALMCYKRAPSILAPYQMELYCKKEFQSDIKTVVELLTIHQSDPTMLTNAAKAELSILLKASLNVDSTKQFPHYLYNVLKLPTQYDPKTKRPTTDYEALLKLSKSTKHPVCDLAIQLRHHNTRAGMLGIKADTDGRIRCGYNIVGSETGRLSCYTSPTGSGYNLQTIPTYDRDLFLADHGHYVFQCDLSGADGWTVAAYTKMLGDGTMLDDLLAGIKPAKVLCYLLRHGGGSLAGKNREEIKALTSEVKKEDWDYFACKCGQHGTCYLMGKRKLSQTIFIQSEGKVNLSEKECEQLQNLFMLRYKVKRWHDFTARQLTKKPVIVSASGHRRVFFGRSREILGEALAHEPQANTTYATNLAVWRLWTDTENKSNSSSLGPRVSLSLRIEPLHQIHDAVLGQFRIEDTAWALGKIREWFNNRLYIANQDIVIPFEGAYGTSWGQLDKGMI